MPHQSFTRSASPLVSILRTYVVRAFFRRSPFSRPRSVWSPSVRGGFIGPGRRVDPGLLGGRSRVSEGYDVAMGGTNLSLRESKGLDGE